MTGNGDHAVPDPRQPPILPAPTPTAISLDICVTPQVRYVILEVFTHTGMNTYFIEADLAFQLAHNIRSAAQAAKREPDMIQPVENKLIVPE